ncbi:hypothetical protein ABE354_02160 [Brevibacillus laterosporus]|uniref:hypothetical protein n=1 Tax=Brevibacillus laterosporus TaxID=1465 RepID=UPI003D1C8100
MALTQIHNEYKRLKKIVDTYRGRKFLIDGSVIGLNGEFKCKIMNIDVLEDSIEFTFYLPEEGYDEKDNWVVEWITISALEKNAKWIG